MPPSFRSHYRLSRTGAGAARVSPHSLAAGCGAALCFSAQRSIAAEPQSSQPSPCSKSSIAISICGT